MTTPETTGESQLQTVLSALLEDRRAMQANIDALMRTVEEQTARPEAVVEHTGRPGITRGSSEADVKLQRLTNNDNVEVYLVTFERLMKCLKIVGPTS